MALVPRWNLATRRERALRLDSPCAIAAGLAYPCAKHGLSLVQTWSNRVSYVLESTHEHEPI